MAKAAQRRQFGRVRQLPSKTSKNGRGRWQAFYTDPEGRTTMSRSGQETPVRHKAATTFDTREDAEAWLTDERRLISAGTWTPPSLRAAERRARPVTLGEYAPRWLATRKVKNKPLADRTRDHYDDLLQRFILPTFGATPLVHITPEDVAHWYDTAAVGTPTYQAHAYGLLRSIMATAADPTKHAGGRPLIPFNPCGIVGGGSTDRAKKIKPPTPAEVATIVEAMPERHRLMVLLADGCALRFGELAELRRRDVDTARGTINVSRAVVRARTQTDDEITIRAAVVKTPKSAAGVREVPVPPHLIAAVKAHLLAHTAPGVDGLLFPGRTADADGTPTHLTPSSFYGKPAVLEKDGTVKRAGWGWYEARRVAGRPDLRFHDLRHGALTDAARLGATLAELMALAGHSTSQAAQRYQHAASERLQELARKRSEATGWVADAE